MRTIGQFNRHNCFLPILDSTKCIKLDYKDEEWIDEGKSQLIFQNDMAYELGGNTLDAVSGIAFSDNEELIPNDEVLFYGKNLNEINEIDFSIKQRICIPVF